MNNGDSHSRLAKSYAQMNAGKYNEARVSFERLANEGERQAIFYLAWMDEKGFGDAIDEARAAERYRYLCEAGDQLAFYYFAAMKLRQGDAAGALALFMRAADSGNPSGAYWASAIHSGHGGYPLNAEMARKYLIRAAELGHVFAQRDLARGRMQAPTGIGARLTGTIEYVFAKVKGFAMIVRYVSDFRVR